MTRRVLALALLLFGDSSAHANDGRNVLFIMADDLKCDLGCYGHSVARTPNIDRLAARGVRFNHAYCQYPVCNPSRASLMSGRRPENTRIVDNATPPREILPNAVFLPQHFRQHGRRAVKVGKIFHTGDAFEDPASWDLDIRETRAAKNPPQQQIARQQQRSGIVLRCEDPATWDGFVARRGAELLGELSDAKQPFFLAVGFRRPHSPYIAPQKYYDLYPSDRIPLIPDPGQPWRELPDLALTYRQGKPRLPLADRQSTAAAYYASVSFMDAQLGVLLDAMDRLNLWENMVVVFVSDHGYHLGDHGGLWHKMTLFENATRVPLIVAAPGIAPAVTDALVELVDLYPTLSDLCELPMPAELEGVSFAPLLRQPAREWKSAAFSVVARGGTGTLGDRLDSKRLGRTLRMSRYRYTLWPDGAEELYDERRDPGELENLAARDDMSALRSELAKRLEDGWRKSLPAEMAPNQ
jgi:uncharacterized sulfatase